VLHPDVLSRKHQTQRAAADTGFFHWALIDSIGLKRGRFAQFFLGAGGAQQGAQQDDLLFFVQLDDEVPQLSQGSSRRFCCRRRSMARPLSW